jgi:hypothetical protein
MFVENQGLHERNFVQTFRLTRNWMVGMCLGRDVSVPHFVSQFIYMSRMDAVCVVCNCLLDYQCLRKMWDWDWRIYGKDGKICMQETKLFLFLSSIPIVVVDASSRLLLAFALFPIYLLILKSSYGFIAVNWLEIFYGFDSNESIDLHHWQMNPFFLPHILCGHKIRLSIHDVTHDDAKWALSKQITWFKSCLRLLVVFSLPMLSFNSCIRIPMKAGKWKLPLEHGACCCFNQIAHHQVIQTFSLQLFKNYYDRHIDKYDNNDEYISTCFSLTKKFENIFCMRCCYVVGKTS